MQWHQNVSSMQYTTSAVTAERNAAPCPGNLCLLLAAELLVDASNGAVLGLGLGVSEDDRNFAVNFK